MPTQTDKLPLPDHPLFGLIAAETPKILDAAGRPVAPEFLQGGGDSGGRIAFLVPAATPSGQAGLGAIPLEALEQQQDPAGLYWRQVVRGLACATFARAEKGAANSAEEKAARDAFTAWDYWADAESVRETQRQLRKDQRLASARARNLGGRR